MLHVKRVYILLNTAALVITACTCSWTRHAEKTVEDSYIKPSAISEQLYDAICRHITYEIEQGDYLYPDSLICAGVWFDFRGEVDSLYILGGPMPILDKTDELMFLGHIKDTRSFISIAAVGASNLSVIKQYVELETLNNNMEEYLKELENTTSVLSGINVCAWWVSSYSIGPNQGLILSNRRLRR